MSVFDELIGQTHIVQTLTVAVNAAASGEESQEMTHAWIFTGPPGSGRSSAAIAFAQALVCKNNGCNNCNECTTAKSGAHPDVEILRSEGLSIKIDEVRELLTRTAWAPSMGGWRVVVMEDADRLTESAANALLKAIEEPGLRTVWLLCAPTLHDLLPTIRSRCRHIQLHTPSNTEVANFLISNHQIAPKMADFAARVSQGHIGRARHLATNEAVRNRRSSILAIPAKLTSISAAYSAAAALVELANEESAAISEELDEQEYEALATALGKGGGKALKELEKEQKSRATRITRDTLDGALLDLATFYRDVLLVQAGHDDALINAELSDQIVKMAQSTTAHRTLAKLDAIMKSRANLQRNGAPLLVMEALMCELLK
ncbi:MAG: DNA polymerase III subunit delta' [Candidatus Nanopelagicaceae bacterium]